ncbi:MAG: hypothetical protein ACOX87_04400 [Chloroflexota bacterium]
MRLALGILLSLALGLRLFLLSGPQTELEADEAIVGLMARHILQGERPIFYWMQPYMGSLEAYLVAGVFALAGSSTFALKSVPLAFALLFVALVFVTGFRIGGLKVAIASGLYIAVPPAFLALWSLKARGGYIEILVIGQLMILIALEMAKAQRANLGLGVSLGLLAGLGLWINPLIAVYIIPIALYLALSMRKSLAGRWLLAAAIAAAIGAFPLIAYNLANGLATAESMLGGVEWSLRGILQSTTHFFSYCLPILAGLSQASSSPTLFWPAFHSSPGASPILLPLFVLLFFAILIQPIQRLLSCLAGRGCFDDGRGLLALLVIVVPTAFVISKFRELVTEPRYLLPLYSAVPLLVMRFSWSRSPWRYLSRLIAVAIVAINLYSITALDPKLNLPDTAVGSTQSNRSELVEFLLSRGVNHIYTDYWLAYPLAFESEEQIIPSVISGGFNRYIPYAHLVSVAPNPAFVFITDSSEERSFLTKLMERQVEAESHRVAIYSVYWQVTPLENIRP